MAKTPRQPKSTRPKADPDAITAPDPHNAPATISRTSKTPLLSTVRKPIQSKTNELRYRKIASTSALIGIIQFVFKDDQTLRTLLSFVTPALVDGGFVLFILLKPMAVGWLINIVSTNRNKQRESSRKKKYEHWDNLINIVADDKHCSPEQVKILREAVAKRKLDDAMETITIESSEEITILSTLNQGSAV